MYINSSAPLNNTALWYYLGTKHLDFIIVPQRYQSRKYSICILSICCVSFISYKYLLHISTWLQATAIM